MNQQTERKSNPNSGCIGSSYYQHLENKFPCEDVHKGEQSSIEFSVLRETEREILKTLRETEREILKTISR